AAASDKDCSHPGWHRPHGRWWRTEDPHGQRKTQQKHHAERKRSQDAAAAGGEIPRGPLAPRPLRICRVRISHLSDHPEHPHGHVIQEPRPGAR
ncbi:unnamed protein product, partial [Tetraodon nigroviridis]